MEENPKISHSLREIDVRSVRDPEHCHTNSAVNEVLQSRTGED